MIEEDAGGGNSNKNADLADEFDDDDHEPCSKKVMPALFAWFLLISTSSSYFTLVLPEFINLIGLDQIYLFVTIVSVHAFIFLYVILNFSIATFMDPGRFPKVDIKESIEEDGIHHSGTYKNVLINDINVRMKWCTTCQFYRPPRSSHCGVCNACIDTMDHHCPWVCNCIARRNYKYFLQFLISLSIHMLTIFGLCLTLVLFNKENLTHIPIIIAILLIVIVGVLIIPIGGLTGFHIVLVSRGRTTNEQVTGKFRTGVNPFDDGCWSNWKQVLCISTAPSYIRFKRKRLKQKEYLETRLNLLKYQNKTASSTVHTNKYFQNVNNINNNGSKKAVKKIYNNHDSISNGNEKLSRIQAKSEPTVVDVQNELHLKSFNNNNNSNTNLKLKSSNFINNNNMSSKKLAKLSKNYNYQHGHKIVASNNRYEDEIEENDDEDLDNLDGYQSENQYDNNNFIFQNYPNTNGNVLNHKQIKQQQQLIEQQMFSQKQKQQLSNVWIDRKSNKIILNKNGDTCSNGSANIDEINIHKLKNKKHSQFRKHDTSNNKTAIDKLMSNERKLQQQQLLLNNNDCASSSIESGSSRCIRNNSYLNANHNLNLVPNSKTNNLFTGVNNSNSVSSSIEHIRPPSVASTSSSINQNGSVYSNLIKSAPANKKKRKAQSKKNQMYQMDPQEKFQLDIIDEKSAKTNQDYASYEITV